MGRGGRNRVHFSFGVMLVYERQLVWPVALVLYEDS